MKEVEKLINSGADPNQEDFDGYTPLIYSAIALKPRTAEVLLKNSATIDHRCKKTGRTPMHIAGELLVTLFLNGIWIAQKYYPFRFFDETPMFL